MKGVILAGGLGTRISEETDSRPKPMVEVGGRPILWHILKILSSHGIDDFVVCLGYKGYVVKEYFANYALHMSNVTVDLSGGRLEVHENRAEPWRVALVDTGERTNTGGRLKAVARYLGDEDFLLTYGDGVSNVDVRRLAAFHRTHGLLATVTAAQPPGRFGAIRFGGDGVRVNRFEEKPAGDGAWINAGFFILSPKVVDYIDGDATVWEREPMERLAKDGQMAAFRHHGFWHPMDTLRDKVYLEDLWKTGRAPWKVW
jgi:glucose-1-phosphate cytidylyltransferase